MRDFTDILIQSLLKAGTIIISTILLVMVLSMFIDVSGDKVLPWLILLVTVKNWYSLVGLWFGVGLIGSLIEYWRTYDKG